MTEQSTLPNDLHGERAAKRGNPSFVWRGGQDRRLQMIFSDGGNRPVTKSLTVRLMAVAWACMSKR